MLAQSVVRAEDSGMVADGVVFSEKPSRGQAPTRPSSKWKRAFDSAIRSKAELPWHLRFVLLTMLQLSDPLGRLWCGQSTLAQVIGCCARTIRRWLPLLVQLQYLRVESMTFKSLTDAQSALGFPVPNRNDEGRAPHLLTLLINGEPACKLDVSEHQSLKHPATRAREVYGQDEPISDVARTAPGGKIVRGEPRTKAPVTPADKMSDDLLRSAILTRKVEGDPECPPCSSSNVEGEVQTSVEPPEDAARLVEASNTLREQEAWQALNAAYDGHYRRVYRMRPVNKHATLDDRTALITCLIDGTDVFETSLRERGGNLENLAMRPLEMLANEALRTWFDVPGENDYLRRVSHPVTALRKDLPYHIRKAMALLLQQNTPKPEPRRASGPDVVSPNDPSSMSNHTMAPGSLQNSWAAGARKILERLNFPCSLEPRPTFG
jgi:Helix-turn-helix domain